jgi:hypothetical protein
MRQRPSQRSPLLRVAGLAIAVLVVSACVETSRGASPPTGTVSSTEADLGTAAVADEGPWWEGRTWDGDIDICVGVTGDDPGCQRLAVTLAERGCELTVYQTFVAALLAGAHLDTLYEGAVREGDCPLQYGQIGEPAGSS